MTACRPLLKASPDWPLQTSMDADSANDTTPNFFRYFRRISLEIRRSLAEGDLCLNLAGGL